MEEKKSYKADLENKRTTMFLLGFIFVMSVFIAVLEHRSYSGGTDIPEDFTEGIAQDLVLAADNSRKDMAAVAAPIKEQEKTEKINIVEDAADKEIAAPENSESRHSDGTAPEESGTKSDRQETVTPAQTAAAGDNVLSFRVVEQLPEYPGGMSAFMKWLTNNLKYPYIAQKNKKQGKVIVAFIINKDGSISDIKLVKGVDASLDREALRVINMMPKWKPGKDNGKPCRTYFCIPVVFNL